MKKTSTTSRAWWDNNLIIGALSVLIIVLTTELLFAIPSKWIHTSQSVVGIAIPHKESSITPIGSDMPITVCTMDYEPVCGMDGKTYSNRCVANTEKALIAYSGECRANQSQIQNNIHSGSKITEVLPKSLDNEYTDASKFHIYQNTRVGYGFSFPNFSWYSGFGPRDGAVHSMAIGISETDIVSFDTAPVRVWFYTKKPSTPPSDQSLTLANGVIYVSASSESPKIQKIVTDIFASAK